MSLPISRFLPAVALLLAAGAAAGDTPCWECRAAACYGTFKQTADQAWRQAEDEAMARWDAIAARSASLEEANVEHDALVAELEQARDEEIAVAYRDMLACLQPEQSVSMAKP